MVCQNVGAANPDIAGIGIVVAFAFQAVLAFILSVFAEMIVGLEKPTNLSTESFANTEMVVVSAKDGDHEEDPVTEDEVQATWSLRREALQHVLLACSDIQTTIGLSLALTGIVQFRDLTLYQYHVIYDSISFVSISNCAAIAFIGSPIRRDISRVVLVALFLILYLVFVILFGIRLQSWDETQEGYCYNAHGIATPAAAHPLVDKVYLALTSFYMYGAYWLVTDTVIFNGDLYVNRWSVSNGSVWSSLYSSAPPRLRYLVDSVDDKSNGMVSTMLPGMRGSRSAVTGFWDKLYRKIIERRPSFSEHERIYSVTTKILTRFARPSFDLSPVLTLAMVQLPLHLYFLIRLRLSNEPLLQEGDTENEWGFGQIYAIVSSAAVLTECVRSIDGM